MAHRLERPPLAAAFVVLAMIVLSCSGVWAQSPAYPIVGKADLPPQSFTVVYGDFSSTRDHGMVGGGGGYEALVTETPHYEIPGNGTLQLNLNVTKREIIRHDPGGLALLSWSMTLEDMDYPSGLIKQVRVVFDTGTVSSSDPGQSSGSFTIPKGARHVLRIESDFAWLSNAHTCRWTAQSVPSGPTGLPIGVGAAAVYYFAGRRRHYLAARLTDEDGQPIPDAEYEMTLANGETRSGLTDADGGATESFELGDADIPGPCIVCYPKLDGSEWDRVTEVP